MKKIFFLALFYVSSFHGIASTPEKYIDVMMTCAHEKNPNFVLNLEDFQYMLNADGALGDGSAKLIQKVKLPAPISGYGDNSSYKRTRARILRISVDSIQKYLDLRQGRENPFPEIKTPYSVGDVLEEFQNQTEHGCDFLMPSRFYSMLKKNPPPMKAIAKKPSKEISQCLEKLNQCEQEKPGVISSLSRIAKSILTSPSTKKSQSTTNQ